MKIMLDKDMKKNTKKNRLKIHALPAGGDCFLLEFFKDYLEDMA